MLETVRASDEISLASAPAQAGRLVGVRTVRLWEWRAKVLGSNPPAITRRALNPRISP